MKLILLIIGILFIVTGATVIILSTVTDLFSENSQINTVVVSSMDGEQIANTSTVTWNEIGISQNVWSSSQSFADGIGKELYTYNIVPVVSQASATAQNTLSDASNLGLRPANSGTGNGLTTTSTTALGNIRTPEKNWVTYPKLNSSHTVTIVSTTIVEPNNGVSFINNGFRVEMTFGTTTTAFMRVDGTDGKDIKSVNSYLDSSGVLRSSNIVQYTCDGTTLSTFVNGELIDVFIPKDMSAEHTNITIGSNGNLSTIYAILVFNRILTEDESKRLSDYLRKKYFAPALYYPTSIVTGLNVPIRAPIINAIYIPTADPVLYEMTLPPGLSLSSSGTIFGTPTQITSLKTYKLTAKNSCISSTVDIMMEVQPEISTASSTADTVEQFQSQFQSNSISSIMTLPNASLRPPNLYSTLRISNTYILDSIWPLIVNVSGNQYGINVINAGDPVDEYTATLNDDVLTVTGKNTSGSSSFHFVLQQTFSVKYPDSINGVVGTAITSVTPSMYHVGNTVQPAYISASKLYGLTLDAYTGTISGTPISNGTSTALILGTPINISILPRKKPKSYPYIPISVGGAAVIVGTICLIFAYIKI